MKLRRVLLSLLLVLRILIGSLLGLSALALSVSNLMAIWTGSFERANLIDGTGDVTITETLEPGMFWENIQFYSMVAALLGLYAIIILWPRLLLIRFDRK